MRAIWFGLIGLVVGCGDGAGPSDGVPALGAYTYTYHSARPGGGPDLDFAGQLIVTAASATGITATWNVPGFDPAVSGGGVNGGRYIVDALTQPSVGGLIINRITTGGPGLPIEECGVVFLENGNTTRLDGTCTLTKQ